MPRNSTVACPAPFTPPPLLLEKELLRRPPQQPVPVLRREEIKLRPHQVDTVLVPVLRHLKGAIALPHAAAGAERLDHALNERRQVGVRRVFLSPRRKRPPPYPNPGVAGHWTERRPLPVPAGA